MLWRRVDLEGENVMSRRSGNIARDLGKILCVNRVRRQAVPQDKVDLPAKSVRPKRTRERYRR